MKTIQVRADDLLHLIACRDEWADSIAPSEAVEWREEFAELREEAQHALVRSKESESGFNCAVHSAKLAVLHDRSSFSTGSIPLPAECRKATAVSYKLKLCPFCGGQAELDTKRGFREFVSGKISDAVAVYCTQCSAEISVCIPDVPDIQPEQLVDMWNTRTPV